MSHRTDLTLAGFLIDTHDHGVAHRQGSLGHILKRVTIKKDFFSEFVE